jgi:hypothetical protein
MQDGWCVNWKHFSLYSWPVVTTVFSYVSTIQTTCTSVIAPSTLPIHLTILTLHFYLSMIVTHNYIPYIPTRDTYPLKHVPFKFSPRVFLIAPHFNLTSLAQSPPLHTYIAAPKGEALHFSIESSILGYLHSFNFFCMMGQSNRLIAKKQSWTCKAPPTNMKQNKYPQTIMGVLAPVENGGKHFWK